MRRLAGAGHRRGDRRRYASAPPAGSGLGFERPILFHTGVVNLRDVPLFCPHPGQMGGLSGGQVLK